MHTSTPLTHALPDGAAARSDSRARSPTLPPAPMTMSPRTTSTMNGASKTIASSVDPTPTKRVPPRFHAAQTAIIATPTHHPFDPKLVSARLGKILLRYV